MKAAQIIALSALALVLLINTASKPLSLDVQLLQCRHTETALRSLIRLLIRSPHIFPVCLSVSLACVTFGNTALQIARCAMLDLPLCMLIMYGVQVPRTA